MIAWTRTVTAKMLLAMVGLMIYLTHRIDGYAYVPTSTAPPAAIMGQS